MENTNSSDYAYAVSIITRYNQILAGQFKVDRQILMQAGQGFLIREQNILRSLAAEDNAGDKGPDTA